MTNGRQFAIPSMMALGLLVMPSLGCRSNKALKVVDAALADTNVDNGGSGGTGGVQGTDGRAGTSDGGRTDGGGAAGMDGETGDASSGEGGRAVRATEALWARTVVSPVASSHFAFVAVDPSGNVYAAGNLWGPGMFDFGSRATATGTYAGYNALLAKYDSSGIPQWAHSGTPGDIGPLAIDSAGNVYALATLPTTASGAIDFGNGVTVVKSHTLFQAVLVKYDPSGIAKWAQTVTDDSGNAGFNADTRFTLAMDVSGNVYVAGGMAGTGTYDTGHDATAAGKAARAPHIKSPPPQLVQPAYAVLVKYDSSGATQWRSTVTATSVSGDSPHSAFTSLALDLGGNVYVAGNIGSDLGSGTYDFSNGVGATAPNPVLVKYTSSGIAQWIRTGAAGSFFHSLAVDPAGNVYGAGSMDGGANDFGNGVTASGVLNKDVFTGTLGPTYPFLVKYDSSGIAQWAQTVTTGGVASYFASIAVDSLGNVYAAGSVYGPGPYDFGNGAKVTASAQSQNYLLLVKYRSSGIAEWARSSENGGSSCDEFGLVTVDPANNVYAAGSIGGPGDVDFGDGVTLTGLQEGSGDGWNALLVKYR
jgi:hypothetical protein